MQRESNEEYHLLTEYKKAVDISSIFSKTNTKGVITYVNDNFCAISGYSRDELIGKSHNIIRNPDMPKSIYEDIWKTIKSKKVWQGKLSNRKKCGDTYMVDTTIMPILDENGEIEEYISIRYDITELEKLKQDEIRNIKTNSVCKLAGGVAHEINTPMTYIKGNIEFIEMYLDDIKEKSVKESIQESIDTIKDGMSRIINIVSAVREISDTTNFTYEDENIARVILNSYRLLYNRVKNISPMYINGKKFDLSLDRHGFEEIVVSINKNKMQQALISIISNSIDEFVRNSTSYENNKIEIDFSASDKNVTIIIADNGGGIEQSILDQIFEPFCSNKEYAGLGMGLNLVKSIIDEHKGSISAYNSDQGAVFKVILPLQ